jgi:hypothetical protein
MEEIFFTVNEIGFCGSAKLPILLASRATASFHFGGIDDAVCAED